MKRYLFLSSFCFFLLNQTFAKNEVTRKTISSIGDQKYIGIGMILDSTVNRSWSFAMQDMLQTNIFTDKSGNELTPVFVDYTINAPYGISGILNADSAYLNVYTQGVKKYVIRCERANPKIWQAICDVMKNENFAPKGAYEEIDEQHDAYFNWQLHPPIVYNNSHRKDDHKQSLPMILNWYPTAFFQRFYDSLKYLKIEHMMLKDNSGKGHPEYKSDPALKMECEYTLWFEPREEYYFFFNSKDVTTDAKETLRPMIYPVHRWPYYSLLSILCGYHLKENEDYGAAYSAFQAALASSYDILASERAKALIRATAFQNLADLNARISRNKRHEMCKLFSLLENLNVIYANAKSVKDDHISFYESAEAIFANAYNIQSNLKANEKSKKNSVLGSIVGGALLAADVYTGLSTSNQAVDKYFKASNDDIDKAYDRAKNAERGMTAMARQNANAYGTNTSVDISLMQNNLAFALNFFLYNSPDLVKKTLLDYAKDKRKLTELLNKFYKAKTNAEKSKILVNIRNQASLIEAYTVASEVKNGEISSNIKDKF